MNRNAELERSRKVSRPVKRSASPEEIISSFVPRGYLPMTCPGTKFVTIGGAIANDIHGKAHPIDGSFAKKRSAEAAFHRKTIGACRLRITSIGI